MNWKTVLNMAGIGLLIAALYELLTGSGLSALVGCGLTFDCYLPHELTSMETGVVLIALGVLAFLTAISIGRKPGY